MTQATLKRLDPTQVELDFGVAAEDLERARERAFRELSRDVRLPGFRPGKAPRKIFEAKYGSEAIEARARDEVLNEAYGKALEANSLEPLGEPEVEELPVEEGASDVRFRVRFAVRPEFALGDYRGITVSAPSTDVPDADVDRALDELRRGEAVLSPVERPVQLGDVATLDYEGRIDGVAFEGGSAKNQPTEIAEGRFIPGFADGIVGMRAGESKDVKATFPQDYANADLAGKDAVFSVTVHDVKEPQLPELDDEFAGRFTRAEGGATLEGLRADVRGRLESAARSRARRAIVGEILGKLRNEHEFALPEVLVEREIESMVDDARRQATRAGVAWEQFLERTGRSEQEVRDQARPEAEQRVKTSLLLERIARAENIRATDADVDAELVSLSTQYGRPKAEILELMRPSIGTLVDGIVRSKTLDFLIEHADKVEATGASAS